MKKINLLMLLLGSLSLTTNAETYVLDLQKSIEIAKEKSYEMLTLYQDLLIADYNLKTANSQFKTHVDLQLTTPDYKETVNRFQDSTGIYFYPIKELSYSGTLEINQPLPTDGRIYIQSGLSADDDLNADERSMYLNTRLGLTQPLTALYGYNNIRSSYKQAKLDYERSQKQLKRAELNLNYSVSNAFYRVLSVQKALEISKLNLERQQQAFDVATQKFKAGLIKEVDALQMEVDLAEARNSYDVAIINQTSSQNAFKELIGIEFSDSVIINSELKYDVVVVDLDKAISSALENRLEIREQEIQIELSKLNIKRQRSQGMIQSDLVAYYQKIGVSQPANVGYDIALNNSWTDFRNRPQNYGVGLNISVPIIDWGENKSRVNAAKARLKQTEYNQESVRRSIEGEVRNLVSDFNSSLKRLQLLEKNVAVAEKSFEITRQRYADGDIDSQALALERDRLNNAYNSHLSAYISYQLMLSDLMRKTFYDFQNDKPLI
jgi:outer membrane protein TolC